MRMRRWIGAVVAAVYAGTLWVGGGGSAAIAAAAYTAPSHAAVLRTTAEMDEWVVTVGGGKDAPTGEHFHQDGKAVVVRDGHGGFLTAIPVVRWPTADGLGQYVLFWHDRTFLGSNMLRRLPGLGQEVVMVSIVHAGKNRITLRYAVYRKTDPATAPSLPPQEITYHWTGRRLAASAPVRKDALEPNLYATLGVFAGKP